MGLGQERSAPLLQGALMLAKKKREPKLEQPLEKDAFMGLCRNVGVCRTGFSLKE